MPHRGKILPLQSSPPFSLAPYKPGDEAKILELFRVSFGSPKSLEHWRWQFEKNPYDLPKAILAIDPASSQLVGHYTVQPIRVNFMGREVKAAQSLDTMVHPEFRMHGIFEASAKSCYEQLSRDGYALVYGFPNKNSFPGFVRKLGWTRVCFLDRYFLKLSIEQRLKSIFRSSFFAWMANKVFKLAVRMRLLFLMVLSSRNDRKMRFCSSASVPGHYDELWGAVKSFEILSLWKDRKYFKWRYDENPSHSFKYFYIENDGKIEALCVVVFNNGTCEMLELLSRDRKVDMARYLVTKVALEALANGASRLTFTGSDLDFFKEVFVHFRHEKNFQHVFCLTSLKPEVNATAVDAKNWTVTHGDSDSF